MAGSALTMDKDLVKYVLRGVGIAVARHVVFRNRGFTSAEAAAVEELGYPCFVKPAKLGSSVGITRVESPDQLQEAVELAFRHDAKVLVEEQVEGKEVECGVLGNAEPVASLAGEIVITNDSDWYDYAAKYDEGAMDLRVPADVPGRSPTSCARPRCARSRPASAPAWPASTSSSHPSSGWC